MQRKGKVRPARRVPADFALTDERRAEAEAEGLREPALGREWAKFRDCEFKTPRSDWPACWRNWVRKALELEARQPTRSTGPRIAPEPDHAENYLRRRGLLP